MLLSSSHLPLRSLAAGLSACALSFACTHAGDETLPETTAAAAVRLTAHEDASGLPARPLVAAAAEAGDAALVSQLLAARHSPSTAQADGMTALHWAALHADLRMAQTLLASQADADAANAYGVRPLAIACEQGHAELVQLLLEAGASIHAPQAGGETPLMTAARTGRPETVQLLLDAGADVNAREHKQQTAVMWAAAEGHTEVVRMLLMAGADVHTPLPAGWTPLLFAVREGRTETVTLLLQHGLDVNAPLAGEKRKRGPSPLLLAVINGHFETAAKLLELGADPNAQPTGQAALHALTAVRRPLRGDGDPPPNGSGTLGSLELVRRLVQSGADVNARVEQGQSGFADFTTTGCTAFVLAAQTGDLPLLKLLLELGADPQIPNADGATAVLAAAGVGDLGSGLEAAGTEAEAVAVLRLLLELGLDINVIDANGETAVHGAAYQNWPQLLEFLMENGAQPDIWNQPNRWGWTPLIIAHGYREGNFRPDAATIAAVERCLRRAGLPIPADPGRDVEANQQSWDRRPPRAKPRPPQRTEQAGAPVQPSQNR